MRFDIHVHHHFDPLPATPPQPGIADVLAAIQELAMSLQQKLDAALAEAQETSTVADSIITLLGGIKAQLDAVIAGEGTVDQVIQSLNDTQARIIAAVEANTPAAPTE